MLEELLIFSTRMHLIQSVDGPILYAFLVWCYKTSCAGGVINCYVAAVVLTTLYQLSGPILTTFS